MSARESPVLGARDLAFERSWTAQAGDLLGRDTVDLIAFAEGRAPGPLRDPHTRDFGREVLEELADGRNYLAWWAQQETLRTEPDGEITEAIATALSHVAVAFDEAKRARARAAER